MLAARERCWWHQRAERIHKLVCLRTSVSVPPSPSLSPSLSSLSSLALSLSLSRSLPLSFSLSLSKPSSLLSPLSSLRSPQIYLTKHVSGCQRGGAIAPPLSPLALWLSGLICSLTLFLSESVPLSPPRFGLPPPSIPEKHAAGCEILLRLGYYNPAARRFDQQESRSLSGPPHPHAYGRLGSGPTHARERQRGGEGGGGQSLRVPSSGGMTAPSPVLHRSSSPRH